MMIHPAAAPLSHRSRRWKVLRLFFRYFRLQDRLQYMSVLHSGSVSGCSHVRLHTGFLVENIFLFCGGNDVLCQDCKQVWVATVMSERYEFSLSAPSRTEGNQEGI